MTPLFMDRAPTTQQLIEYARKPLPPLPLKARPLPQPFITHQGREQWDSVLSDPCYRSATSAGKILGHTSKEYNDWNDWNLLRFNVVYDVEVTSMYHEIVLEVAILVRHSIRHGGRKCSKKH